jgi:hypothetical protein
MEKMADAYMDLGVVAAEGDGLAASYGVSEEEIQDRRSMTIVDVFCTTHSFSRKNKTDLLTQIFAATSHQDLCLVPGDVYLASACIRRGWMPVSPWTPTVAITIRVLEVYRVAHLRCPRLGIQVFVRALCDIHGVAPRQWLGAQFSIAFDVYLAIRAVVDKRVQVVLGHDTPDWRLKNACPPCLYKLEGEPRLEIPLMVTIDGNNSLSHFHRRERVDVDEEEEEEGAAPSMSKARSALGASKERLDNRAAPGDYYLAREEVDRWSKDGGR